MQLCPRSEYHLDYLLKSLPQSLDETYERILCNINNSSIKKAQRILTLLYFASRFLIIYKFLDGIAVKITHPIKLNRKRRLQNANDIRKIYSGLVNIGLDTLFTIKILNEELSPTVRIAHFFVQEYLEFNRI